MTSPQLGNSWRSTLLRICSQPPCPANLIMANDQFSKEGLKPQLSNSPFEKRGIKGDFSTTSAAAIGCIFLNELWFQDTRVLFLPSVLPGHRHGNCNPIRYRTRKEPLPFFLLTPLWITHPLSTMPNYHENRLKPRARHNRPRFHSFYLQQIL